MVETLRVSDPERLSDVLDLVHDWWFDLEDVRIRIDNTIQIRLSRSGRYGSLNKRDERLLCIAHVESVAIDDTERVGRYDIDEVRYQALPMALELTGGVPIRIHIGISSLDVSVLQAS